MNGDISVLMDINETHLTWQMSISLCQPATVVPDSFRLCDGEVEECWAGGLHAGIPGQSHPASPLEGSPALRQKVHQQGRGVQGEQHLPWTFLCWQVAQSWEEVPEEREEGEREEEKDRRYCQMTTQEMFFLFHCYDWSSLPQSFFARPRPPPLCHRHLGHPVGEALLWALTLHVAAGVSDQERQQSSHFLLQTGSLLSQPWAQRAECGEDKRVTVATWIHLREQEETRKSVVEKHSWTEFWGEFMFYKEWRKSFGQFLYYEDLYSLLIIQKYFGMYQFNAML